MRKRLIDRVCMTNSDRPKASAERRRKLQIARAVVHGLVAALDDPELAALLKRTGKVVSGARVLETGLPDDEVNGPRVQALLMSMSNAAQQATRATRQARVIAERARATLQEAQHNESARMVAPGAGAGGAG